MKLALIRHGITDWNLEKRIQGHTDLGLAESGRQALQALRLPPDFIDFAWYCSPLRRACETADLLGIADFSIEPDLIEMSWGQWEGEILKPLRRKLGQVMRDNESRGIDFQPPGGESPRQVQQRLRRWLSAIAESGRDSAAITHQGVIRCIYALASGWDMRGETPVEFAWDAIHEFEVDDSGSLLDYYRQVSLLPRSG